jgi:predicted PurR-regulated permease PerM
MIAYFGFIIAGRARATRKLASLSALPGVNVPLEAAVQHIATRVELYPWAHTVTGVIIATTSAVVMVAVGLHNAVFWSILLFMLCYIPLIGVTVGSIVPALFALVQFAT